MDFYWHVLCVIEYSETVLRKMPPDKSSPENNKPNEFPVEKIPLREKMPVDRSPHEGK